MSKKNIINSFCVDMEEWFHISANHSHSNPKSWSKAETCVIKDTEKLLELFSKFNIKVTFLVLGWIAKKHPDLIKRIASQGHEIGCHGFYHRLIHTMTPEEFELDTRVSLNILREISNQSVEIFRAPSFSITNESLWVYPILSRLGVKTDISIVPARRDNGGIVEFPRNPVIIKSSIGSIRVIPVSVMELLNIKFQFSGGGFLRFLPYSLIKKGFDQNLSENRSVMSFIHPREINRNHPRLNLSLKKYIKCYYGLSTVEKKLNKLFSTFSFSTVSDAYKDFKYQTKFRLDENNKLVQNV